MKLTDEQIRETLESLSKRRLVDMLMEHLSQSGRRLQTGEGRENVTRADVQEILESSRTRA